MFTACDCHLLLEFIIGIELMKPMRLSGVIFFVFVWKSIIYDSVCAVCVRVIYICLQSVTFCFLF